LMTSSLQNPSGTAAGIRTSTANGRITLGATKGARLRRAPRWLGFAAPPGGSEAFVATSWA